MKQVNKMTVKKVFGLSALCLVMFIITLDSTITNIALPTITDYFQESLTNTNWISTIYVMIMSVFIIPASKFGDQFGRRRVMLIGLVLFGIGSVACGLSENLLFLISMRVIQGIGGAIVTPIVIPLSVSLFGRETANKVVAIIGAVTAVAAAAGPPLGGLVIQFLNWKWIFFINLPFIIITVILVRTCFKESVDKTISKKIDFAGLILLLAGLFQLTYALIRGYDIGWTSPIIIGLIASSIVCLTSFYFIERYVKNPLIEFNLFSEPTFTASTIAYFACGFAIICSSLIFNFFLENVRDYSALHASFIIMFMSIIVILSMPLGSKLAEKFGYRSIITLGMIITAISLLLLSHLSASTSKPIMISYMIILGFGFGFACLSIVSAVQYIPVEKAGIASGIVNAGRQLGTCLGIAILVGTMTHSVDVAKTNINNNSQQVLIEQKIPDDLQKIVMHDLSSSLHGENSTNNTNFQTKLKKDLTINLKKKSNFGLPIKTNNRLLYDALGKVNQQFSLKSPNTIADTIADANQQLNQDQFLVNTKQNQLLQSVVQMTKSVSQSSVVNQKLQGPINALNQSNLEIEKNRQLLAIQLSSEGKLSQGISKLQKEVAFSDLQSRLQTVAARMKDQKNQQLSKAFNQTFLVAAIIITLLAFSGPFCDKKS